MLIDSLKTKLTIIHALKAMLNNIINIFTNGKWNKGRRSWGIKFNETLTIEIDYPIIFDINNNPVYSLRIK